MYLFSHAAGAAPARSFHPVQDTERVPRGDNKIEKIRPRSVSVWAAHETMPSKLFHILDRFSRFITLLLVLFVAGCGGEGGSKEPSTPDGSDPKFSMPLPKGLWAPASDSDLVMTARAVIDPGKSGERTVDLAVDLTGGRVTGEITEVPAGRHTVEIRYFINQVQVATVTLDVDVAPGQNNPLSVAPTLIRYVEAVSDALFVADAADQSIKIFDRFSNLKGGVIQPAPTRTLQGERTGIGGPSSGSLFVDSIGGGLYFADTEANVVRIWNAASVNGNAPPDRVLEGSVTQLLQPSGIAFDPFRNRLYVVNGPGKILIWNDAASISGGVSPTAVVSGPSTDLVAGNHPVYLDVKADTLYVANGTQILVFEKLSALTGPQEVAPARIIEITGGLSQAGVAGDPIRDLLFVSSRDPNGKIYQLTGASAASTVPPTATLAGSETGLNQASSVALAADVLMALNQGGSQVRVWHHAEQKKDDASPTQIIEMSPALPTALFYVATQNGERDQAEFGLTVQKSGQGSVTSDLPGINCGTTCSAPFPAGSQVTLTAVAEAGSTFAGFGGNCVSTTTSCTFAPTADAMVTATFSDIQGPSTPSNLIASVANATQINLSWVASIDNIGTSGYWIERCQGAACTNFARVNTSLVTGTTFSDGGLTSGAVYRYRVQAQDAVGNLSAFSNIATASTLDSIAPSVPTNLTATPATNGTQIDLSWTASTDNVGVSGYWIERCTGATCTNFARVNGALIAATTFSNTSLTSATTYRYRVQAEDAAGNRSPFSAIVNATTPDTVNPSAPTGLTATAVSGTQINLSWNPSTDNVGVTGYQIQRCPGTTSCLSGNPFVQIGTTTDTTFNNTGLTNGTSYRYRVRAVDAAGRQSSFSNIVTATTRDTVAPTAPTDLTATPVSDTQIDLSWIASTDNVGVNGYWIERCTGAACTNFARVNTSLVTDTNFSDTGLTSATTYRYRVQAVDAAGNLSPFSTIANATTLDTVVPTISNVAASDITETGATITWTTNEASDSQVEYGTTTSYGNSTPINTSRVTSHTVALSGLTPSTLYHYRVKSRDAAGNLATSGDFTFTTDDTTSPSTPSNLSATAVSGTQINLSWTSSTDNVEVSGYQVQRCQGSGCTDFAQIVTPTTASFSDTGLINGTTYRYRVRATDAAGNLSGFSNIAAATTFDTSSPTAPSNLTAASAGANQIDLSWISSTDNVGVSGYWIERCQGAGCSNFVRVNTALVSTTNYNDTGLTADTNYSYRVQAADAAGNLSSYSNTASAATAPQIFTLTVTKASGTGTGTGTVTSSPAGINCGTDCTQDYTIHTVVTLTATPDADAVFAGWAGACTNTAGDCVVTMDATQSVEAKFIKTFTLTVSLDPAGNGSGRVTGPGINCGDSATDCSEVYTMGTTIELAAEQEILSQFSGWSGDCTGTTSPCTLFIDSNKSVQARFDLVVLPAE